MHAPSQALPAKPTPPGKPKTCRRSTPVQRLAPSTPQELLDGFCPEPTQEEQIAVNPNGLMLSVRLADIEWMEAADDCVKLHVGPHTQRLRDTLTVLAAKLPPGHFLRISRSTLVNIEQIQGLQRMFFDEYEVVLRDGTRLPLTRAYWENLRQIGLPLPAPISPTICDRLTLGGPASSC
jgi:DNA-binding LytR/AlgR family response regulator